ncbi:MAG: aldehyde dehydrogenase family protein [Clostridiales Family XIII bacterium]|jgi:sulfoacetaldehyde dehydrogenase|nr:aldehyde dehydrogenase family protein [Clostridiales Family XIII bacterium]
MDVNYGEYIASLVTKARAAQEIAEGFSQEKVDELCEAVAYCLTVPETALKFSEALVAESGMGIALNKQAKMYGKIKGSWAQMKGKKSVGLIESNSEIGIDTYAKPMGVVGAIMPVTNGEATPVVKSLMALKTRNAIILAPHPKAKNVNKDIVDLIRSVLHKFDAPVDLVQAVAPEYVSMDSSRELMKQVDFILATGGTPMVRQAYSSGNPTIGVGTGNVVCIVDETADLPRAADMIMRSKTFDHATSCSTENNIIVIESVYDAFIDEVKKVGGLLIKEDSPDKEKIVKTIWPETPANHNLNRDIVAQSAKKIAAIADIDFNDDLTFILVEENGGYGNEFPLTGEKLSPVSGIRKAKDFSDAVTKLKKILDYQGLGHSASIHTEIDARVTKLGKELHVAKLVVNQPQSLTNSGSWTCGYPVSMTLGCGTWGHNSISHNATYKDLLNFTYVSREIPNWQPSDDELFSDKIRNAFA